MIFDLILSFWAWLMTSLLRFLPESSGFPDGFFSGLDVVFSAFGAVDAVVPASEIFALISFIITFELAVMVYHSITGVLSFIRGSSFNS